MSFAQLVDTNGPNSVRFFVGTAEQCKNRSLLPLLPLPPVPFPRPTTTTPRVSLSGSILPPPMLVMFIAFLVAAFALLCIRFPSVWSALMAIDEPSDHRELGLVVASRTFPRPFHIPHPSSPRSPSYPSQHIAGNPFRESGPPACMAKLIMMRHKVRSSLSPPLPPILPYSRPLARLVVKPV